MKRMLLAWVGIAALAAQGAAQQVVHEYDKFFGSNAYQFGRSLDVHDSWAVISASGGVYFHQERDGAWEQSQFVSLTGVTSVAVHGQWAAVGRPFQNDEANADGVVDLYRRVGGSWSHATTLHGPAISNASFGHSIAIEGERLVVGAPGLDTGRGTAWVYDHRGIGWVHGGTLNASDGARYDQFGLSVALEGDRVAVGAPLGNNGSLQSGATYVFERDSMGGWSELQKLAAVHGRVGDRYGFHVDMNDDVLAVGAPYRRGWGAAYVYALEDGAFSRIANLHPAERVTYGYYGIRVAVDAGRVLVSHPRDTNTARIEVYELPGASDPVHVRTLQADRPSWMFGHALAVDGPCALVGSFCDGDNGSEAGAGFAFNDLPIGSDDTDLGAGDTFVLDIEGGDPSKPVILCVVDPAVPGFELRLAVGTFDTAGRWTFRATVPSGLEGLDLDLRATGITSFREVRDSNLECIQIR